MSFCIQNQAPITSIVIVRQSFKPVIYLHKKNKIAAHEPGIVNHIVIFFTTRKPSDTIQIYTNERLANGQQLFHTSTIHNSQLYKNKWFTTTVFLYVHNNFQRIFVFLIMYCTCPIIFFEIVFKKVFQYYRISF